MTLFMAIAESMVLPAIRPSIYGDYDPQNWLYPLLFTAAGIYVFGSGIQGWCQLRRMQRDDFAHVSAMALYALTGFGLALFGGANLIFLMTVR